MKKLVGESKTAKWTLIIKYFWTYYEKDPRIRTDDWYCKFLLSSKNRMMLDHGFVSWGFHHFADARAKGFAAYISSRTKHLDELFKEAIYTGPSQIVILGAGYDTRFYRMGKQLKDRGIKCFEVDLPSTQSSKTRRLLEHVKELPKHVVYIPIDFSTQNLKDVLGSTSYSSSEKTFFLWEGVCFFLKPEAVSAVLNYVHDNSAIGSRLVFDYIYQEAIDKHPDYALFAKFDEASNKVGEKVAFGIPRGRPAVEEYLKQHRFALKSLETAEQLEHDYLMTVNEELSLPCPKWYAIAEAVSQ